MKLNELTKISVCTTRCSLEGKDGRREEHGGRFYWGGIYTLFAATEAGMLAQA